MIKIGENLIKVDIQLELEPYIDQFHGYKIRDDKLQSCSPFRQDSHPSFAVNLENGSWIDSGAVGEFHKGHFITLLAFLREESFEDTAAYLLDVYCIDKQEVESLHLSMDYLNEVPEVPFISTEKLQEFAFRHSYLSNRGIAENVQRQFRVGYSKQHNAVVMPHTDKLGNITNIKFRSVSHKKFWYYGGQPVKNHLYGLYQCIAVAADTVWIVESEIDCMRLWTEGIPAIALGTAHISKKQIKLIMTSPIERIVIATDNDTAGEECAMQLVDIFIGKLDVELFDFPDGTKDICDLKIEDFTHLKTVPATLEIKI